MLGFVVPLAMFLGLALTFMVPSVSDVFGNDGHHVACVHATQGHQLSSAWGRGESKIQFFLDAIASPSTYSCQSVSEWVND